jgi:hypothetical protein
MSDIALEERSRPNIKYNTVNNVPLNRNMAMSPTRLLWNATGPTPSSPRNNNE